MTIDKLEQYYGIRSNIDAIDEEIRTLYNPVSCPNGKEGGGSSTPSNPTERAAIRIAQLKEMLEEQREQLGMVVEDIERWLATIEDKEIVSIIRWHYLLRCNWKQTCLKVYGYPDYDYCRKKIIRYFEKLSELSE